MDVQSEIIDGFNESRQGQVLEVLCEGFDGQVQMFFGRSYAESPDIDGRIYFTAQERPGDRDFRLCPRHRRHGRRTDRRAGLTEPYPKRASPFPPWRRISCSKGVYP